MGKSARTGQEGRDRLGIEFEEKQLVDEPCSQVYLRRVTGEEDLGAVRSLVLNVDTNGTQVTLLEVYVPFSSNKRFVRDGYIGGGQKPRYVYRCSKAL